MSIRARNRAVRFAAVENQPAEPAHATTMLVRPPAGIWNNPLSNCSHGQRHRTCGAALAHRAESGIVRSRIVGATFVPPSPIRIGLLEPRSGRGNAGV